MRLRGMIVFGGALCVSACAPTQYVRPSSQYTTGSKVQYSENEPAAVGGDRVSIKGQAFLRQRGGGVVTAAGNPVYLVPEDSNGSKWLAYLSLSKYSAEIEMSDVPLPPGAMKTTADAEGRFTIDTVPPGKYRLLTRVAWETGISSEGGWVVKPIDVTADGTNEFVVNSRLLVRPMLTQRIGDSHGFLWDSCDDLREKAIAKLSVKNVVPKQLVGTRRTGESSRLLCRVNPLVPLAASLFGLSTVGTLATMSTFDSTTEALKIAAGSAAFTAAAILYPRARSVRLRQVDFVQ